MGCDIIVTPLRRSFLNLRPFSGRFFNCLYALSAQLLYVVCGGSGMFRFEGGRVSGSGDKIISVKREVPS